MIYNAPTWVNNQAPPINAQNLNELCQAVEQAGMEIEELKTAVGSPLVASTAAGMTDKTKIYVYTGSESGYVNGNWYYWDGSAWTSGGVYNSTAFTTDTTLSISGQAADAKATGDAFLNTVAEQYSSSQTYNVGDYVLYNWALYRCNTEISLGEAWTPAHWTAAELAADVAEKAPLDSPVLTGIPQVPTAEPGTSTEQAASTEFVGQAVGSDGQTRAVAVEQTVTGFVAQFSDGADGVPVKDLTVTIAPSQSGSGDPSPDNVRNISGWTEANISRTGTNLWGGDAWYESGLGTADPENRTITAGSTSASMPIVAAHVKFKENTRYTFIVTMTSTATHGNVGYSFSYTDGTRDVLRNTDIGSTKQTFVFVSNGTKTLRGISRTQYSGNKTFYVDECGLFEGVVSAEQFVPYEGTRYTVDWTDEAGTVYGGTLDVTTGLLTVTDVLFTFNGTENWLEAGSGTGKFFRYKLGGVDSFVVLTGLTALCNRYSMVAIPSTTNVGFSEVRSTSYNGYFVYLRPADVADITVDQFKAMLADWDANGAPLQVTAKPAQPATYQLTPTEIDTLLGENNIWSNAGDVEVTYRADTESYVGNQIETVEEMIAGTEATETATVNYAIGDFLIANGGLYKVTSAIAAGETIVPGTNCTMTTVAEQLKLLFSSIASLENRATVDGESSGSAGNTDQPVSP